MKVCWGPGPKQHRKGCRPGRPLCRWMRKKQAAKYSACFCGFAHFPHRRGWCSPKRPGLQKTHHLEETEAQQADRREAEARRDQAFARLARLRKVG